MEQTDDVLIFASSTRQSWQPRAIFKFTFFSGE